MPIFAISIFSGAFLFFWIQPLLGRFILPAFGGTATVWSACLLFFQLAMLAGYAYAHLLGRVRRLELQVAVHLLMSIGAAFSLPFTAPDITVSEARDPALQVLQILLTTAGLPCLVLAGTSTLTQLWWVRCRPTRAPYRLYAASNAGSLLGLLLSTLVFDSVLSRIDQGRYWAACFVLYGMAMLATGTLASMGQQPAAAANAETSDRQRTPRWLWLALPFCGSVLLLGFTTRLTSQFAVVPFLWTLPLAVYLLTYILAFDHPRWYSRRFMVRALPAGLGAVWLVLFISRMPITHGFAIEFFVSIPALFVTCLFCHGELHRLRPEANQLSLFYLWVSAGGALGGFFVSIIAPLIFDSYAELPLGLFLCAGLAIAIWRREHRPTFKDPEIMRVQGYLCGGLLIYGLAWAAFFMSQQVGHVVSDRNFFGVCGVSERATKSSENRNFTMLHGATIHGIQFAATNRQQLATAYFGPESGLGKMFAGWTNRSAMKIGAIGLGTGTVATYGRPGDLLRFYELNPLVIEMARDHFSFISASPAEVSITVGDARANLTKVAGQEYDLLIIDAFNGGTIPIHLLTREAFLIWQSHLSGDGVIAIHVTNRHLDLAPIVAAAARELGFNGWLISHRISREESRKTGTRSSDWVILARDANRLFNGLPDADAKPLEDLPAVPVWTDERSSLLGAMK